MRVLPRIEQYVRKLAHDWFKSEAFDKGSQLASQDAQVVASAGYKDAKPCH